MIRRRLQRRTEVEETPGKRPRVSSLVKAGSSSVDGTSVQHTDIVDEQEAVEKIRGCKLNFHFKRQKSEACAANAELVLSDSITMAVRRRVHVVSKSAVHASLLADLEKRFGPMDPSRHLQLLNITSYTGGLTKVENVWQLNNFIHRCHAQPVQDFPWLEVREMPTIKGRGVFAKVDIAKGMAVADYRGYRGLTEDVLKPYNKGLAEENATKLPNIGWEWKEAIAITSYLLTATRIK
ncbi:unnamed protein product [Cylicocyclus nassatus]|uniref:Uncharacterized protein n=1 Tax=Cylicocyclus nassatus TaxID=53992 RepID=A0AA36H7Q0_CYLNA|nr:unnamed protein product [Cylicocyclus nassatus]